MRVQLGNWQFAPGVWPTLAALFFFVLTLSLGNWQTGRADYKRDLQARYDTAAQHPPVHVGMDLLDKESVLYRRIEVEGVFDPVHEILLDNRVLNGVAGYHVLTPLRVGGGETAILVNRGWVATGGDREQLPQLPRIEGTVRVEGLAVEPQARYFEFAGAAPDGRLWQNLDFDQYALISGLRLQPVLLLQTSEREDGLLRRWPRPDTGVATHVAYALQWYGLAATLVVLWLVLNIKRTKMSDRESGPLE
jgi:surfeit locus 1 family protein